MNGWTRKALLPAAITVLAAVPFFGINIYWLHVLNLTWISAIAALGLNLATGSTGQIVLGQAALMGVGAYTAGIAMLKLHHPWWLALLDAIALAALAGVLLGALSVRIKGHYLAITTLGLNEIFRMIAVNEDWLTGGPLGLRDIPAPALPALGADADHRFYLPLLAITLIVYAFALVLQRRRLGRDMRAVRDDEMAAEAMGVDSRWTKIKAFVLCSTFGALAGALYALSNGFISPNNFTIFESIKILLMTVLGGLGALGGTLLGAALVTILPEALRALETYYIAAFGLGVVVVLLVEPRGLGIVADWLLAPWIGAPQPAPALVTAVGDESIDTAPPAIATRLEFPARPAVADASAASPALLELGQVEKRFGGVVALDGVSFAVRRGEILGLIGPNGSGKSTLINACSGVESIDAGRIELEGKSLAGLSPWAIHDLGVSRIFQNVRLWGSMTVLENVMVALRRTVAGDGAAGLSEAPRHAVTWRESVARDTALAALDQLSISFLAHRRAADLSFGQSRLVEIARANVTRPRLLLLDEPAAGLRGGLVMELAAILQQLRSQGTTILVVEHRIKLVMAMCDRVVVLNLGRRIAAGTPDEIQRDPRVIEAYLGEPVKTDSAASSTAPPPPALANN